jgi:hypothetical protein
MWTFVSDNTIMTVKEAKDIYSSFKFYFAVHEFGSHEDDHIGTVYAVSDSDPSWDELSMFIDVDGLCKRLGVDLLLPVDGNTYHESERSLRSDVD